jgi:hypothetical protein
LTTADADGMKGAGGFYPAGWRMFLPDAEGRFCDMPGIFLRDVAVKIFLIKF